MRSLLALTEKPFVHKIWVGDKKEKSVFEIDTKKADYMGTPYKLLSSYQKRKFENMLVLENPKIKLQFRYL